MDRTILARFFTADGLVGQAFVQCDRQWRPPAEVLLPVRVRHHYAQDAQPDSPSVHARRYELVRWSPLDPAATQYEEVFRG